MTNTINKPSTYRSGRPLTGYKDHAVAPGTAFKPNPHVRIAKSLCGQRIFPTLRHFDPKARTSCQRCVNSMRVLKGAGA